MESSIAKTTFLGKMMVFAKIEGFDRPDGVRTKNLKNMKKFEKVWNFEWKNLFLDFLDFAEVSKTQKTCFLGFWNARIRAVWMPLLAKIAKIAKIEKTGQTDEKSQKLRFFVKKGSKICDFGPFLGSKRVRKGPFWPWPGVFQMPIYGAFGTLVLGWTQKVPFWDFLGP